ncbi:MAG TPA: trehalase family glycosidase [Patescibacteria group bacterium]
MEKGWFGRKLNHTKEAYLTPKESLWKESRNGKMLDLESDRFKKAFVYIDGFRQSTIRTQPREDKKTGAINLGESKFLVPNTDRFGILFYWDSYFMMQPNLYNSAGRELARSTIQAFSTLLDKKGFIPNASTDVFLNSSQAPLYSSMIMDTYLNSPKEEQDAEWLRKYIDYAKEEYHNVWNNPDDFAKGKDGIGSNHHYKAEYGLSKYGDRDGDYSWNAERESGWDFTSRFGNVAIDYLPIDLNCFLYKYEIDFAKAAEILGNQDEKEMWLEKANERKKKINDLMWDEKKGYFFDYNYRTGKKSPFYSLASFSAIWSGLASEDQAKSMSSYLSKSKKKTREGKAFNNGLGLMVTDKASLPKINQEDLSGFGEHFRERIRRTLGRREELTPQEAASEEITGKQWDYPHVWAPTEHMVIVGLLNYAKSPNINHAEKTQFKNLAKELMEDYLVTLLDIFEKEGTFPEKFNGMTGKAGNGAHYAKQSGFGWTCSTFEEFAKYYLPQIYQEDGMAGRRLVS